MSEDAAEALKRMRDDAKKDEKKVEVKTGDPDDFYVRLIVNKLRRRQLAIGLMVAFCAFIAILGKNHRHPERSWWLSGLPIAALGLIICVIPPSEEWEYKPWQARPRQYEKHQIER